MTYARVLQYLESFIDYEKIPAYPYKETLKLERVKGFLTMIGNPQDALRCLHIAGTKGKGSTCAFITYILREAGFRAGLYTSPHLADFRERIRILSPTPNTEHRTPNFEGMISKKDLADLVDRLKPAVEKYNQQSQYGPLTFFEVYTALAFTYFKEKKVDFAVLETGLGGRLDATNVVNPLACAITPISYEHTQKLGNTLREIAGEKAGIIKGHKVTRSQGHKLVVIVAPQEKEAREVIRNKCKQTGAMLYEVGKDITYKEIEGEVKVKGLFDEYNDLKIGLRGEYQFINAAVAIGLAEALRFYHINIGRQTIKNGLAHTLWPGRCEVVSRKPLMVLDGAQNIASAQAIKQAIKKNFQYKKLILVLGISQDKDIPGVCRVLYGLADRIVLTQADNPRAMPADDLAKFFKGKDVFLTQNIEGALKLAKVKAKKSDLILVTGSLFVVGEARNLLKCKR